MNIQPINNNTPNFKSSVPVFVMLRWNAETTAPVVGEVLNDTFMKKTEHLLNNTLKRGNNAERDALVDKFRERFGKWVKDFGGKVSAFTCVDGGIEEGVLKPYFYFLTGDARGELAGLRKNHKDALVFSQFYRTANVIVAKDDYYTKGKELARREFKNFHPFGMEPHAMFVTFVPERTKSGKIKNYKLYNAQFKPLSNVENPSIQLEKL